MNAHFSRASLFFSLVLSGSAGAMAADNTALADSKSPLPVAVLASGNGGNAVALWKYFRRPSNAGIIDPKVLIYDRKTARVPSRADEYGVPCEYLSAGRLRGLPADEQTARRKKFAANLIALLKRYGVTPEHGLVVGAGFMSILDEDLFTGFAPEDGGLAPILNIHPALLPAYKGADAIKRAFAHGVKETGVSVHYMTAEMDAGPLIMQKTVPVLDGDSLATLEKKMHAVEHRIYPHVVKMIAQGKVTIEDRSAQGGSKTWVSIPDLPEDNPDTHIVEMIRQGKAYARECADCSVELMIP
jgi:phosphoribosylglycinamide formyltransferase-1